jgi:hypothetical protein
MMIPVAKERDRHYTVTGIIKGAAAINELRTLLLNWTPGEDHLTLLKRVLASGALGKATAYRAQDIVVRVFRPRLLLPSDAPARHLKAFLEAGGNGQPFREMLLIYEARAEDVLYDFICGRYWPASRAGELWLRVADAIAFLDEAVREGQVETAWSDYTKQRTASALLQALSEFGFLRHDRAPQREIVSYRMTDVGLAYLAHDLHFAAVPDNLLVEHPDWGLFGLDRSHLLERLDALPASAGLLIQRAGSVVRISWLHTSMRAFIHAITR